MLAKLNAPFYPRRPDAWKGVKTVKIVMKGGFGSQTSTKQVTEYAKTAADAAILQDRGFTVTPIHYTANKE